MRYFVVAAGLATTLYDFLDQCGGLAKDGERTLGVLRTADLGEAGVELSYGYSTMRDRLPCSFDDVAMGAELLTRSQAGVDVTLEEEFERALAEMQQMAPELEDAMTALSLPGSSTDAARAVQRRYKDLQDAAQHADEALQRKSDADDLLRVLAGNHGAAEPAATSMLRLLVAAAKDKEDYESRDLAEAIKYFHDLAGTRSSAMQRVEDLLSWLMGSSPAEIDDHRGLLAIFQDTAGPGAALTLPVLLDTFAEVGIYVLGTDAHATQRATWSSPAAVAVLAEGRKLHLKPRFHVSDKGLRQEVAAKLLAFYDFASGFVDKVGTFPAACLKPLLPARRDLATVRRIAGVDAGGVRAPDSLAPTAESTADSDSRPA